MRLSFPPRRRSMRACWDSDRIMTHLNYLGTIITRQMAELAYRPARGACYRLGAMIFLVLLQRWEKREQLPVRRHFHSKNATVYAFRREIDEWRESRCVLPERAPMEKLVCGPGNVQSPAHWDSHKPAVTETSSQGASSQGINEAPCLVFILWFPSSLFEES